MGQEYSRPLPGTKLQIIGVGLPRTGTSSLTAALEILLKRPVYHGGTQFVRGPESEVRSWIKVMNRWPTDDRRIHEENLAVIRERLDGYAAVNDVAPLYAYLEELAEMYPDAKFVCSVRDVESWEKSIAMLGASVLPVLLASFRFILWPLPTLRYFPEAIDGIRSLMGNLYGERDMLTRKTFEAHEKALKRRLPSDRLVFVEVKDGWEPLCRALNLPVPEGIPFPRINDAKAVQDLTWQTICRGASRWMLIAATVVVGVYAYHIR